MSKSPYIFIILLFISQFYYSQDNSVIVEQQFHEVAEIELNWMPTYKEALKKSKKEKKPVLIYFTGSVWCSPCKILDKNLFHTEKFKALADQNLVLLEIDIPRRLDLISAQKMAENKSIQKKYKVKSFPTVLFVNYRGKKLAEKKGYFMAEYYYPFFQSEIDKY
jgi:thioredoxin-related protein